jgi:hypothetical protein
MKQILIAAGVMTAIGGVLAGIHTVAAHHATTMFDHSKTLTIKGVVTEVRWVNPHVSLWVKGTIHEEDEPTVWALESTSPGNLVRRGWSRGTLKPGDKVVVEMSPLRESDKKGGAVKKVTLVDTGVSFQSNIRDEAPGGE